MNIKSITKSKVSQAAYILLIIPLNLIAYVFGEYLDYSFDMASIYFSIGILLIVFVLIVLLIIGRLNDIGVRGINWLVIFIPILNIGFSLWLMIKPGDSGLNNNGGDSER